jgi:hypothetical protein
VASTTVLGLSDKPLARESPGEPVRFRGLSVRPGQVFGWTGAITGN